jgi:CheY-like chemotaxis protein
VAPRRGKILVVDDEPAIANTLARMLGDQHDVTVETDSRNALARLSRGEGYDVVLCDLTMPSVSGMDLYNALAAFGPEQAQRMVFMTGGAVSPRSQAFLDTVANASVMKPFAMDAIRAIVNGRIK